MKREQFIGLLQLAQTFAYDLNEPLLFTGKSLRDILIHLEDEYAKAPSENEVITAWQENAATFRRLMTRHARQTSTVVKVDGIEYVVIREDDAVAATSNCPKGIDYH